MNKRLVIYTTLVMLSLLMFSCSPKKYLEENKPKVTFKSAKADKITFDETFYTLTFDVHNKAWFDFPMDEIALNVYMEDGTLIAETTKGDVGVLPAGKTKEVSVSMRSDNATVITSVSEFTQEREVVLNIEGYARVSYKSFSVDIPIKHTERIDMPAMPKVRIKSYNISKANLSRGTLHLSFSFVADSSEVYDMNLKRTRYKFYADGALVSESVGNGVSTYDTEGGKAFDVDVKVSLKVLKNAALSFLGGGSMRYRFVLEADYEDANGVVKTLNYDVSDKLKF